MSHTSDVTTKMFIFFIKKSMRFIIVFYKLDEMSLTVKNPRDYFPTMARGRP